MVSRYSLQQQKSGARGTTNPRQTPPVMGSTPDVAGERRAALSGYRSNGSPNLPAAGTGNAAAQSRATTQNVRTPPQPERGTPISAGAVQRSTQQPVRQAQPTNPNAQISREQQVAGAIANQTPRPAPTAPPPTGGPNGAGAPGTAQQGLTGVPNPSAATGTQQLADLRELQSQERTATEQDLARTRADALQRYRAQANLSGGGLAGNNAAGEGDIARVQDRGAIESLASLDRNQRDEQMNALRDQTELADLEELYGSDINQDGTIGLPEGATPAPGTPGADQQNALDARERRAFLGDLEAAGQYEDLFTGDQFDAKPGSKEVPYVIDAAELPELKNQGFTFTSEPYDFAFDFEPGVTLLKDQNGNYFIVGGKG